jgi:hypothetical protein
MAAVTGNAARGWPEPGVEEAERATAHRQRALRALPDADRRDVALVETLLALEARLDELVCWVARLG